MHAIATFRPPPASRIVHNRETRGNQTVHARGCVHSGLVVVYTSTLQNHPAVYTPPHGLCTSEKKTSREVYTPGPCALRRPFPAPSCTLRVPIRTRQREKPTPNCARPTPKPAVHKHIIPKLIRTKRDDHPKPRPPPARRQNRCHIAVSWLSLRASSDAYPASRLRPPWAHQERGSRPCYTTTSTAPRYKGP